MKYSTILWDAGNVAGFLVLGTVGGLIVFGYTVLVEFLILQQYFHFMQKNRFKYVSIANGASLIAGFFYHYFVARFSLVEGLLWFTISFFLTLVVETLVWLLLLKPTKRKLKAVIGYNLLANCASYALPFVFLFIFFV